MGTHSALLPRRARSSPLRNTASTATGKRVHEPRASPRAPTATCTAAGRRDGGRVRRGGSGSRRGRQSTHGRVGRRGGRTQRTPTGSGQAQRGDSQQQNRPAGAARVGPAEVGDRRDGGYLGAQQESGYPKGKWGVQGEKVRGRRLEDCLP